MINFEKLKIESFKSIFNIEIDFNSLENSLYLLEGINNTVNFALSNGAGKSTIWDALSYALYGTVSGIYVKNEEFQNKNTNIQLKVELYFSIDEGLDVGKYHLIRTLNSTYLYKDDKNITELTKTETEKKLLSVLNLSKEEFFSFTYLTQNSTGNFLGKTTSEKFNIIKDFVFGEELLNIKNKIDSLVKIFKNELLDINNKIQNIKGKIEGIKNIPIVDKNELWTKSELENQEKCLSTLLDVKNEYENIIKNKEIAIKDFEFIKSQIDSVKAEIEIVKKNVCPTCNQTLVNNDVKQKLWNKATQLKHKGLDTKNNIINYDKKIKDINSQYPTLFTDKTIDKLNKDITEQKIKLKNYYRYKEELKNPISTYEEELKKLYIDYDNLEFKIKELSNLQKYFNTTFVQEVQQSFIKEIKNYLNLYCYEIFDGEYNLKFNNNNLELYINNKPYYYFSGGERQRIDFLFVFAIKIALSNFTNKNTNILIFDESLSGSDKLAYENSIELINRLSKSMQLKTIIISHKNELIDNNLNKIIITRNDHDTKLEISNNII